MNFMIFKHLYICIDLINICLYNNFNFISYNKIYIKILKNLLYNYIIKLILNISYTAEFVHVTMSTKQIYQTTKIFDVFILII